MPQNNPRRPEEVFTDFLGQIGSMVGQHTARLFCHQDKPEQVTCIMTVGPNDHAWLNENGHQAVQGTLTLVFHIDPDFRCVSRPAGSLNTKSCYACRAELSPAGCTLWVDPAFKNFF